MERMVAYCGLVCTECDAYLATQSGDREALEKFAERARQEFGMTATAESTMCDGCLSSSDRLCGYCDECGVRACAVSRGVTNCAHCEDYGCETITGFLKEVPVARSTLEEIRANL
jgi:hypothetical protein